MFPEGGQEGLYHTADATLWFFHAVDRYHRYTRDDLLLRELLPTLRRIVDAHREGTRFGIGVDPGRRPAAAGRGGLPAHVDGRQGRRLGGHAAARQGGRDQRALVQRGVACWRGGCATATMTPTRTASPSTPRRSGRRSTRVSGTPSSGCLFDVVDGESGDDPACRPNQVFAMSLRHPVLDAAALGRGPRDGAARVADARGPALALACASRLQATVLRRPAHARRGVSPGHRVELADRPVHRCVAGAPPGRRGGRAPLRRRRRWRISIRAAWDR